MSVSLFDHFAVQISVAGPSAPEEIKYKLLTPELPDLRDSQFEAYRVQWMALKNAHVHPTRLVESANLASVAPPKPWYRPMLEPDLITNGRLSLEQFETVVYAGQAMERLFRIDESAEPVRGGFFDGDGTGVGKGRVISAVARDCINRRPTVVVWFSLSDLAVYDARRDWADLGGHVSDVQLWSRYKANQTIPFDSPILYAPYSLLRREDRYKQLVESLKAKGFDILFVFDEAHAGMNARPLSDSQSFITNKRSDQGNAMLNLQRDFPNARVFYASATGASRPDALAYAERLNIWGSGTPFKNQAEFYTAMVEGGTIALEQIAYSLKSLGRFVARSVDLSGSEFETVLAEPDRVQAENLNAHLRTWRMIHEGYTDELIRLGALSKPTGGSYMPVIPQGSPRSRIHGNYEAAIQRACQQHLISISIPTAAQWMKEKLDTSHSVIVQLTHTNEAELSRAIAKMGDDDTFEDLDITGKGEMLRFLEQHYPVHEYKSVPVAGAKTPTTSVETRLDKNGDPIVSEKAVLNREKLRAAIEELDSPLAPIDMLYKIFGENNIAEITGRTKKTVWRENPETGVMERLVVKRNPKRDNLREKEAFLNGEKRIIIISEKCGGVAISLHSDIRYKNQQRRAHLFLEMSWSAEGLHQGAGRSARTGQVNSPLYAILVPGVPGFRRFMSTPARRLAALGAISKGQRNATEMSFIDASYNLETRWAYRGLQRLMRDIAGGKHSISRETLFRQTGIDAKAFEAKVDKKNGLAVRTFLNRLLHADIGIPAAEEYEGGSVESPELQEVA